MWASCICNECNLYGWLMCFFTIIIFYLNIHSSFQAHPYNWKICINMNVDWLKWNVLKTCHLLFLIRKRINVKIEMFLTLDWHNLLGYTAGRTPLPFALESTARCDPFWWQFYTISWKFNTICKSTTKILSYRYKF